MISLLPPTGYPGIKIVNSFEELITTPFGNGVNALCWPRTLPGDFAEVVELLSIESTDEIINLDEFQLNALPVSEAGRIAVRVLIEDLELLRDQGLSPELNCIRRYPREVEPEAVPTDVYSFHADSATAEADTWLCTYHGLPSEGLRNDEARRRVDLPETRAELLRLFGSEDDDSFLEFLNENCYDLHYAPSPEAQPFSFGLGNLWRIATEYPGSPVPPCIHRAPENLPGQPPRLLLIS